MDGFSEGELLLISKVRIYHHLLNGGLLSGKHGNLEAKRRQAEIAEIREELGLTKKQQASLMNRATLAGI